uniref:Uncharacterized protein n=1 Tax=Anguilla anguilla TaxID=7936 RepID=A0A0E9TNG2_ANGAN
MQKAKTKQTDMFLLKGRWRKRYNKQILILM